MKLIDKISPNFIKKLDQHLLINSPTLWVLKLHYLLFWQFSIMLISFLASYLYPQSLGSFPNIDLIAFVFGLLNALLILLWVFQCNQFDIRTRNFGKPMFFEQARVGAYTLAFTLFLINIGIIAKTLNYQTTQIIAPVSYQEYSEASAKISYFERHKSDIARGYYTYGRYDQDAKIQKEYVYTYTADSITLLCKEIGELNAQYGDGILYTAEEIYEKITDTIDIINTYSYKYASGENMAILNALFYNEYKISIAFYANNNFYRNTYDNALGYTIFICLFVSILMLLITYYKYFGIYQIITGVLSPSLFLLIMVLGAFVLDQWLDYSNSDTINIGLVLILILTAVLFYAGFKYQFSSKTRIVILQIMTVLLPSLLLLFYFGKIDNSMACYEYIDADGIFEYYGCEGCFQNPEYSNCLEHRKLFETSWALGLGGLFLFVGLPMFLKILYRQYYLPAK